MQSQNANLAFIKDQPESFFGKLLSGATPEKISQRMNEIRESLSAVNMVSLAEAMALVNWWSNTTEEIGVSVDYYSVYGINILSEADILKMRMQTILELLLDTSYLLFSLFMAV